MKKFLFEISAETRDLLAEARRKPALLERWSADQRLLKIVAEIRASGEPGVIGHVLEVALAKNGSVRSAAREAVKHLLSLIPNQAISELDEAVRRGWEYLDLWYGLRPEVVAATKISTEEDAAFLRVATRHPSGYVREQAVRGLVQDESADAVPFLLIRAADWVPQIRVAAHVEICRRLHSRYADSFVSCLSLLDRLRGSQRFAPELWESIRRFLKEPDSSEALQKGLESQDRAARRRSFFLAVENSGFKRRDVIEAAVSDADVLIRKWAFTFVRDQMPAHWPELRNRAVRDPFPPIRRMAFESLAADPEPRSDQLLGFLLDASPALRHSAQESLPKLLNVSVPAYYRAALGSDRGSRSICALGLAEVRDAMDAASIAVLIRDPSAKTRRSAIRALRILRVVDSDSLLKVLNSDVPSVAREAAISLLSAHLVPADLVWKEALANRDPRVWRIVLKSFNNVDKWTRLRTYLGAVETSDNSMAAFAVERLRIWLGQYNRSFTLPQSPDVAQISAVIGRVLHKLPDDVARELSFVVETVLNPTHNA